MIVDVLLTDFFRLSILMNSCCTPVQLMIDSSTPVSHEQEPEPAVGTVALLNWTDKERMIVRFRQQQHEAMTLTCTVSTVQAGGGCVVAWGMFSWHT